MRIGQFTLKGTGTSDTFAVEQDSYAPESVEIELPGMAELAQSPVSVPVSVSPDYADMSKLEVNAEGCSAVLKDNTLEISFSEAGESTVTVLSSGKAIYQASMTVVEEFFIQSENVAMISCEGGEVKIPVNTNDNIKEIATPDWITLTDNIPSDNGNYTFKAEPNKTGKQRSDVITFHGQHKSLEVNILQDSYMPQSIDIPNLPSEMGQPNDTFQMIIYPEYADWSKISLADDYNGAISIQDNRYLSLNLNPGTTVVEIKSSEKSLFRKEVRYVPDIESKAFIYDFFGFGDGLAIYFRAEIKGDDHIKISKYEVVNKEGIVLMSYEKEPEYIKDKYVMKTDGYPFRGKPYFPENVIGLTFRVYANVYEEDEIINIPIDISALGKLTE